MGPRALFYLNMISSVGILIILIVLTSCGRHTDKVPKQKAVTYAEALEDKAQYYLANPKLDHAGWIDETKCDGLLFTSLYAISGGSSDPMLARDDATGQWFRHPDKDCYSRGDSQSTVSRDMFMGLFLWIWHNKRLDVINDIISYGEAHATLLGTWRMGDGDSFRTDWAPSMQVLAYDLRESLGGDAMPEWTKYVPDISSQQDGFEAHLQVLRIYLMHLIHGSISRKSFDLLETYAKTQPQNALFQAVYHRFKDGEQVETAKLLLDTDLFPRTHTPTSQDRCEFYLWQRNAPYSSCRNDPPKRYNGVDFLFVKAIIMGEI